MSPDSSIYPKPNSVFNNCQSGYGDLVTSASLRSKTENLWEFEVPADTQFATLSFNLWLETYLFFKQCNTGEKPTFGYSKRIPNVHQPFQIKVGKIKDVKKIVVELEGDSTDFFFNAKRDMALSPLGFAMYGKEALKSYQAGDNTEAYDGVIRIVRK